MADDTAEIGREAMEAVAGADVIVKGNGPAFLQNLSYGNAVAFQQAMQKEMLAQSSVNTAIYTKAADLILNTSPEEGVTGSAIAEILAKIGGNVPPVTP